MSSNYPPGENPAQPSSGQPPQTGQPEYLESGSGQPAPQGAPPAKRGGKRTGLVAAAAIGGLVVIGGGVWAVSALAGGGSQPDSVLPADTIGYVSVDLDPSAGQKVEAIRMLRQFPAFTDEVDIKDSDDLRREFFDLAQEEGACADLVYADDVEPWIGERVALAAVADADEKPVPALVLQVSDTDAAETGFAKLNKCSDSEDDTAWAFSGNYAVISDSQKNADDIVAAGEKSSLADDADYQKWTEAAGDKGVISMYAAPEAGQYFAESMGSDMASGYEDGMALPDASVESSSSTTDEPSPEELPEELQKAVDDFPGMAGTVRFDDGALEMEVATGNLPASFDTLIAGDAGDDVVATLPEDTAVAVGLGFKEGWVTALLERFSSYSGEAGSTEDLLAEAEAQSGLELPEDIETLVGESFAFAMSGDVDFEALANSADLSDLPMAVKVKGDPEGIESVLDKIRPQLGEEADMLITESEGDYLVYGLSDDYVSELAGDGELGDSEIFQDAVPQADAASAIVFVNFNAGGGWLENAGATVAGDSGSGEFTENVEPLKAMGFSTWSDDEVTHTLLKISTD